MGKVFLELIEQLYAPAKHPDQSHRDNEYHRKGGILPLPRKLV